MKKKTKFWIYPLAIMGVFSMLTSSCKDGDKTINCRDIVNGHPGYEVWAGDTPYFQLANHYDYFYNIDKNGYTLIGSSTTTKNFNTGSYKYYVIVAKYYACIDAIQFNDSSYYDHGQGYTLITGLSEYEKMKGAPDGIFGKFGYLNGFQFGTLCPPPVPAGMASSFPDGTTSSFSGYLTDDKTILSRGGGLTVIIGSGCQ